MATLSDNMRGAVLMIGAMAAFTFNDACMKALSDEMPLFQAIFLRGLSTITLMLILTRWVGPLNFRVPRRDLALIALRSACEMGATFFFLTALFNMEIANVTAILQVLPLTVTLAGALFFREALGWRRILAILIGFIGVILIVRPGSAGFNLYSIYALIAVVLVTVRDLSSRRLSAQVTSMTVAFSGAVGIVIFAGIASLNVTWVALGGKATAQLLGASVFLIGGYLFSVMVMRVGDISFTAPFRYTSLIWALILGLLVFGDWPDALTLFGIAIVVATGVFTFYRERQITRTTVAPLRIR